MRTTYSAVRVRTNGGVASHTIVHDKSNEPITSHIRQAADLSLARPRVCGTNKGIQNPGGMSMSASHSDTREKWARREMNGQVESQGLRQEGLTVDVLDVLARRSSES